MADRPQGRKKRVTGGGSGVKKRGQGLGSGPVGSGKMPGSGSQGGSSERAGSGQSRPQGSRPQRVPGGFPVRSGGRGNCSLFLIVAVIFIFVMFYMSMGSGSGGDASGDYQSQVTPTVQATATPVPTQAPAVQASANDYSDYLYSLFGANNSYGTAASAAWASEANTGTLDTSVASGSREKRTVIRGGGQDDVTILIYMCGTDLESRSAMATRDLNEMMSAQNLDALNVIVYTGGCRNWQTKGISSSTNQIYKVSSGKMTRLENDMGSKVMTDPNTLVEFIKYGVKNFPANRYELILWDHGGGSNTGYGYDEKYANAGSMDLSELAGALKKAGVTFDFVGFDACLMATVETAMVLTPYADYLIASEETEPGVGWYYTDWLTKLAANPSMPTLEIGKNIIDTFVSVCATSCRGQDTTLSIIDLAELENTVPSKIASFAASTSDLIQEDNYQQVSKARSGAREFAPSSRIDQVDLIHLAKNMGTKEGDALAEALLGAVKYNRTSSSMTNAYGLSIYFPYKNVRTVNSMVKTYDAIGMDSDYTKCIQEFAAMEVGGQAVTGGSQTSDPLAGLLGQLAGGAMSGSGSGLYEAMGESLLSGGSSGSGESSVTSDLITSLLMSYLTSDRSSVEGLDRSNTEFMDNIDVESTALYLADHLLDASILNWTENAAGQQVISLPEVMWEKVQDLQLSMMFDDGEGYIDLGLDNVFDFDEEGNLLAPEDRTWLSIDGQAVAYYMLRVTGEGDALTTVGRVPAYLNGERVNLILVFDEENPYGYVAGACYDYKDTDIEVIAKNLTEITAGDQLDFVCDYYTYDGEYQDSYYLGETMTVEGDMSEMEISNTDVGEGAVARFLFSDYFGQSYWTPALEM